MINFKTIARNISLIENKVYGYEALLLDQNVTKTSAITGITGSPGAGKSTLTDALIEIIVNENKKVAVLCIDPSSPFNMGALLGDRIRMNKWYNHPDVFIRSMASRETLGGLCPMIIEVSEYVCSAGFDFVFVETVGVGQSEIEIAGLADVTVLVTVPEGGDDIQIMKSGIMEIADILVVNKCDRPGADDFAKHLQTLLAPAFRKHDKKIPVIKTIAEQHINTKELYEAVTDQLSKNHLSDKKYLLLARRAYQLIGERKMNNIKMEYLVEKIKEGIKKEKNFSLYHFVQSIQE